MTMSFDSNRAPELFDAEYEAFLEAEYQETINTQGADPHAGCSIYNSFGMCGACEDKHADSFIQGKKDFADGVRPEDGFPAFLKARPDIDPRSDCPSSGYFNGWGLSALCSDLGITTLPFVNDGPVYVTYSAKQGIA
jgi:hypothetical protein